MKTLRTSGLVIFRYRNEYFGRIKHGDELQGYLCLDTKINILGREK